MRFELEAIGEELEAQDEVLRLQSLESLKLAQKTFALLDIHARIQAYHFPDLSKKIGDKGMFDWAFPDKSTVKTDRKQAEAAMAGFANFLGKKA